MSRSDPRVIFGVHSVTPYSRTTGLPYGSARVIGEASLNTAGELVKLYGGSSRFPFAIEQGTMSTEVSLKLKEYESWLWTLFQGKAPTAGTTDTSGAVTAITNKNGTSLVAATGIASVTVKAAEKADLKFTKFVAVATDATHVDVYAMSDIDFARGVDKSFESDALKITASPLEIATDTAVEIPDFGLELTGGSGTIAMTVGDTGTWEVKPPSSSSMSVTVGGLSDTFPEFGLIIVAQQQSSGRMIELDIFRAIGIGLPISFAEKKFSEPEIKVEAFYDSSKSGIYSLREIVPS